MNSIRYRLLFGVLLLVAASSAVAQNYPLPALTPNTDVPCTPTSCPNYARENLLTIGYPPVLSFVGRWADSESARDYQQSFRTARPRLARMVPGRHRLYTLIGSALAAYDIDNFFGRLSARPQAALTPATAIPTLGGNPRYAEFGPPEVFLWWDAFFYAENGGGWITTIEDGIERLFDFDWDDRGNVYLAYSVFGWGMVKDNGEAGGGWFSSVAQAVRVNGFTPDHILSVKTGDGFYYSVVSDKTQPSLMQVWDVRDAAHPVKLPDISGRSFYLWAKDTTGSRIAIVESSGGFAVYTPEDFVRTGSPIVRFTAGGGGAFGMLTSDGTNFYAHGVSDSGPFIDVISPSGNTYVEKRFSSPGYSYAQGMHYGDGFLALYGSETPPVGAWNIRLYKVGAGTLTEIPFEMPVPGSNGSRQQTFWSMYYAGNAPAGYAHPYYNNFLDVVPYKSGSKLYLVVCDLGLGDVWEVKTGDPLTARLSATADTANPNSAAPTGSGPFYGDRQTFTSSLASGNSATIHWDFGDNTSDSSLTGGFVKHQYGGITSTTSLPLVRHVTAANTADTSITDSVTVTLAAPQPRFRVANSSFLFTQPDASSAAPIVAGDLFADASDGSVEGHYTGWTLDGTTTKKLPSDTFSVGSCGTHSLAFNTHYGPYSGTGSTLASTGSDLQLGISPFNYTVRPYVVTVQEPSPASVGDANAVFTASVRLAGANNLPAREGTATTYKWELVKDSTVLATINGTATLGTIPAFSVPRTAFSTLGLRVRLTTSINEGAAPGCSAFASSVVQSSLLNGPDPQIAKSGCATVGAPCSFTVTSVSNPSLAGWSFAWNSNPSVSSSTGTTAAEFKPQFTTSTDYSVSVTATNGIGSTPVSLPGQHIDKPACSSAPDNINMAIGLGTNPPIAPGDTVSFLIFPRGWVPSAQCDSFTWTFDDGGSSSTDMQPTHTFSSARVYNVTLVLKGAQSTGTYTLAVTVGTTSGGPGNGGPGPGPCSAPQSDSAYMTYFGSTSSCTASAGACSPGETLQFDVRPNGAFNLACGTTIVSWAFGDGTFGSGASTTHVYGASGLYHAQVTVQNSGGQFAYPQDVQVGAAQQPKVCGTLTNNVAIGFNGTNCTETGGDCSAGAVALRATSASYDFSCTATHTYDWDFGDGSAHSTAASPVHSYGAGTYTAKLTVSNGSTSGTASKQFKVITTTGGGNPGSCGTIVPRTNVYIYYFGANCSVTGGTCNAATAVTFQLGASGYDLNCGTPSYSWDFGDHTGTSTEANPSHKYTANGVYTVKLTFSNGSQTTDITETVTVTGATPNAPRGGTAVRFH